MLNIQLSEFYTQINIWNTTTEHSHPDWCGLVDWVSSSEPKVHRFDSRSGHMPGLQARSPVGDV